MENIMKGQEPRLSKLVPILLITPPATLAVALVAIRSTRWTDNFYIFVNTNRATVGLIVHVIASALGACQVLALTQVISYIIRRRLQNGHEMSLKILRFWVSIVSTSVQSIRSSISRTLLVACILSFVSSRVPAALWVGALTPVLVLDQRIQGQIAVPTYPIADLPYWQASFRKDANSVVNMTLVCEWRTVNITNVLQDGISATMISTCPAVDQAAGLIGNMAAASRQYTTLHSRVDNAGWTYTSRSYGVGASPGIVSVQGLHSTQAPTVSLTYIETGYDSQVTCLKNTSLDYGIVQGRTTQDTNTPGPAWTKLYEVTGRLPISAPNVTEYYGLVSKSPRDDNDNSFGWSALSDSETNTNMLAVAGTGVHSPFNKILCTVDFVPAVFQITINVTESSINVTKLSTPASDIEPTGQYARAVFYTLEQLARMSSVTVQSSLAIPLTRTYDVLTKGSQVVDDAAATRALSDGITSLLDDLFVANAQSQLVIANQTVSAPLTVGYRAIKLGTDPYIFAIFGTGVSVLLIVLFECARTRFWSGLTGFDFADMPAVAVAASVGGRSIATAVASHRGRDDVVVKFERGFGDPSADALVHVRHAHSLASNGDADSFGSERAKVGHGLYRLLDFRGRDAAPASGHGSADELELELEPERRRDMV